ncbi:MAG: CCA tRNA nucleotidyltransferase [Candidatus Diapherotrites archaeon]|nr:CCA tRNA nucleotidyltransferase [Candidatus Diapherotrites archaeon]
MEELLREVLERIRPSEEENERLRRAMEKVRNILEGLKEELGFVDVVFAGSAARDTHLRGSSDVDVFILFPKDVEPGRFEEVIKKLREVMGGELLYAQHPYLRTRVDGVDVEIVPAYKIEPGERILSATDRTPLHNEYVKRKLRPEQRDQVRLLKAFMKGIGVYGAEIKVEGFSGYLCELLVIHYGSFLDVLRAASEWRWGEYIDIEGKGKVRERRPLVVVDPVDPHRNVAHSVSRESMGKFIVAAREFLKSPSLKFFFPRRPLLSPAEIKNIMDERRSRIVGVFLKYPEEAAPDNVWGQLKKLGRRLRKKMEQKDNFVIQHGVWTDEKNLVAVLLEVGGRYTARIHLREGPPVTDRENSERFLEKHRDDPYGPFIIDGRLYAFYFVEEKSLLVELFESMEEIAREESVGGELGEVIKEGFDVVEGRGILRYAKHEGFRSFLSDFLVRKFPWEY